MDTRVSSGVGRNGSTGARLVARHARGRRRSAGRGKVLVLNATYEPINVCTVRRAVVLVLKEKAEVLEGAGRFLHSEVLRLEQPSVIRLREYARIPRDPRRRKITRRAVLARDQWACQYCGSERGPLTLDHVVPRSRGGDSGWDNITSACAPCNRTKGDRLPAEARMHPRTKPGPPGPQVFIQIACPTVPDVWGRYLAAWSRTPEVA
ncbi:MAG: HNH endonuclease [Solirubrobacterales bacterium]